MKTTLLKHILPLALLLLVSCTPSSPEAQQEQQLIPFKGVDLNGQPFDLETSIGKKPVLLIFWASWCPSCTREVPKINQLAEKYRSRGMEFIAVNVGYNDSIERAKAFVQKTGMTYPAFFDESETIARKYQVQGVPTVIIADKQGIIRFRNFNVPDISEDYFTLLTKE